MFSCSRFSCEENNTRNGVNVEELFNTIDADVPQEQLEELIQLGPTYTPPCLTVLPKVYRFQLNWTNACHDG